MNRQELVEKMASTGWEQYCPIVPDMRSDTWKAWMAGMDAALSVAIEELKSEAKEEAVICEKLWRGSGSDFITDVFSRLMIERVKTPAERIEVKPSKVMHGKWDVYFDGELSGYWDNEHHADIYAEGLRTGLLKLLPKNQ